jgi:hypothetical protein
VSWSSWNTGTCTRVAHAAKRTGERRRPTKTEVAPVQRERCFARFPPHCSKHSAGGRARRRHGHRRGPACRTGARAPRRATAAGFRAPRAQPPCRGRESTAPRPRPRERTVSHTVFEPMLRLRPCWEDSGWMAGLVGGFTRAVVWRFLGLWLRLFFEFVLMTRTRSVRRPVHY